MIDLMLAITTGAAKLEAVGQSLEILPGQANSEQSTARYQLQPRDSTRSEIFLIRTGDTIYGSKQTGGLLCKWDASEVQVNSSAASDLAVSNVDDNELGVTETPEEETADEDEDLDKTVDAVVTTQTKTSQRPQATPKLSAQQSLVVEETPTIARINDLAADSYSTELDLQESHFTNVTPLDNPEQINVEQYSTARTGESQQASEVLAVYNVSEDIPEQANAHKKGIGVTETPSRARVVIPLKRQSLIPLNVDSNPEEAEQRPAKRRKGAAAARNGDDTPSSHSSQLIMEAKAEATPSRRRGRQKPIDAREGAGTPQSQRSTSVQADTYDGPVPYVALSNSSIAASGHTVKFLKKQGGSLVDSVKGDFNMLW